MQDNQIKKPNWLMDSLSILETRIRIMGAKYAGNGTIIPIKIAENKQDWEFVLIDRGKGVKGLSVF